MSNDDKSSDFWNARNIAKEAWDEMMGGELRTGIPYKLLYSVPRDTSVSLERHCRESGIPYIVAANLLGSESGYNAKAVSPTGAAGLAQMIGPVLYEKLYKYAGLEKRNGPNLFSEDVQKIIKDNVEKYDRDNNPHKPYWLYRIKEGGNSQAVDNLAHNEDVALIVGFKHMEFSIKEGTKIYMENLSGRTRWMRHKMDELIDTLRDQDHLSPEEATARIDEVAAKIGPERERVLAMEAELDRTFTATDLKVFYVCGPTGGAELLEALADPVKREQRHRAADYAPKNVVDSNPRLFFKDYPENTMYKDVVEFYEHMEALVGSAPLPDALTSKPQEVVQAEQTPHPPLIEP